MADFLTIEVRGVRGMRTRLASGMTAAREAATGRLRVFAERVAEEERELIPTGFEGEGWIGPHLNEDIEVRQVQPSPPKFASFVVSPGTNRGERVLLFQDRGTADEGRGRIYPSKAGGVLVFTTSQGKFFRPSVRGVSPHHYVLQALQRADRQELNQAVRRVIVTELQEHMIAGIFEGEGGVG